MSAVAPPVYKPIPDLPESLSRASVDYRRTTGYTAGAPVLYEWRIQLHRAATREEKRWLKSHGFEYGCGWWSATDPEGATT